MLAQRTRGPGLPGGPGKPGTPENPWRQLLGVLGGSKKRGASKRRPREPVAAPEPALDVALAVKTHAAAAAAEEKAEENQGAADSAPAAGTPAEADVGHADDDKASSSGASGATAATSEGAATGVSAVRKQHPASPSPAVQFFRSGSLSIEDEQRACPARAVDPHSASGAHQHPSNGTPSSPLAPPTPPQAGPEAGPPVGPTSPQDSGAHRAGSLLADPARAHHEAADWPPVDSTWARREPASGPLAPCTSGLFERKASGGSGPLQAYHGQTSGPLPTRSLTGAGWLPGPVVNWSREDWRLVARALELAGSDSFGGGSGSPLSDSEKAHCRELVKQLLSRNGPFRAPRSNRGSRKFSEFARDLSRANSSMSFSSELNDVAAEYARELAALGTPVVDPSGSPESRCSTGSASGQLEPDGSMGLSGSGQLTGSGPVGLLKPPKLQMLQAAAARVPHFCAADETPNGSRVCDFLLETAIEASGSRIGLIGSVHFRPNGAAYLKTHSITNVAWTPQLRQFYEEKKDSGLVFSNMDTLFGAVVKTGKLVLCNDSKTDPRASGTPPGHPKIRCFLGMPLYLHGKPIGAIAVANRPGGYTEEMAKQMDPYNQVVAEVLGHYLHLDKMPEEAPVEIHGAPAQIAKDAFLAFNISGLLTTMNKPAEAIFGECLGESVELLFTSLSGGEVEVSAAGLEALANRGTKVAAEARRKDWDVGQFDILVSRGLTDESTFLVSLWEADSWHSASTPGSGAATPARAPGSGTPHRGTPHMGRTVGNQAAGASPMCPRGAMRAGPSSGSFGAVGHRMGSLNPASGGHLLERWGSEPVHPGYTTKGAVHAGESPAGGSTPGANGSEPRSTASPSSAVGDANGRLRSPQTPLGQDNPADVAASKKQMRKVVGAAMRAYEMFEADETPNATMVSDFLLAQLLSLTNSSMGLIGSVHVRPNGAAFVKTHAITNVAWTDELKRWYQDNSERGLVFSNTNTLFGAVVLPPFEPIITNDPMSHPKATGTPAGHPVLDNFLGVPLFHGTDVIGLICLANNKEGFSPETVTMLSPLTKAIADVLGRHLGYAASSDAGSPASSISSRNGQPSGRKLSESGDEDEDQMVQAKEVAYNVSRLSTSQPGAAGMPVVHQEAAVPGQRTPWESEHGTHKGPKTPFPPEWTSDVGPLACPYLAQQKATQNLNLTALPTLSAEQVASFLAQHGRSGETREEMLMSYVMQAEEILATDKTPNGTLVSDFLLDGFLALTQSKIGFIASAHYKSNGAPYIKTHAMTDVSWTPELSQWYADNKAGGLVFSNLNTLFGAIVRESSVVLSNDPSTDTRSSGTPPGHPKIESFMGIPLFSGSEIIGAVGFANRPGGYSQQMAEELQPLIDSTASIIKNLLLRGGVKKRSARKPQVGTAPAAAADAFLAFDSTGLLSSLNKPAEELFGPRNSRGGRTQFSDLFSSVAGIAAQMDTEGLDILAGSGERLPAALRKPNGEVLEVFIEVSRGAASMSKYVVAVWPKS